MQVEENYLDAFTEYQTAVLIPEHIDNLQYSPTGETFSFTTDSSLKIYSSSDMGLRNVISTSIDHMKYFQNNTLLYSKSSTLFYLSVYDNKLLRKFDGHSDEIKEISVNPNNDTFMSIGSETVKIWDFRYQNPIFSIDFTGNLGSINRDSDYVLSDGNFIYLFDRRNQKAPLYIKSIRPNFYRRMWYTADSTCICISSLKTHMCLDSEGEFLTSVSFENTCDPDIMNESNILLFSSSTHLFSYKIADKKTVGRLGIPGFQCATVRANPVTPQFICASDALIKAWSFPYTRPD